MDLSAFNLEYLIGNDLREKPIDAEEYSAAIQFLERSIQNNSGTDEKGKVHSKLGSLLRIVGRHEESLFQHLKADEILKHDPKARFINRIRMASAYQFLNQNDKALELLKKCLSDTGTDPVLSNLADYVHQHLGKVYFEMGALEQAIEQIGLALALRNAKGNEELVRSSKFALSKVRSHIQESKNPRIS